MVRTKENQGDSTVANSIMSARYDGRHNHGRYCVARYNRAAQLLRRVFHVRNTRITIALLSHRIGSTDPGLLRGKSNFVERFFLSFLLFLSLSLFLLNVVFTFVCEKEKAHRISKRSTICRAI